MCDLDPAGLHALIVSAFQEAVSLETAIKANLEEGKGNRRRSQAWLASLVDAFRRFYHDSDNARVLARCDDKHRQEFGLCELLYDVLVCQVGSTQSYNGSTLSYIQQAVWQVESEFNDTNSKEALKDFNKLVIGAAQNKLFVGPASYPYYESLLRMFRPAAPFCVAAGRCKLYAAFVPHPREWGKPLTSLLGHISLWDFSGDDWDRSG